MKPNLAAILLAAGSGLRCRQSDKRPKQFLELGERPMYDWSLSVLLEHPGVDQILLVTLPDMVPALKHREETPEGPRVRIVAGGATRQESVWCGLQCLSQAASAPDLVLLHDASRPFLRPEILNTAISAAQKHGACTTAIPASDTIKRVEGGVVVETLDRSSLMMVQTPQVARFDWLVHAHRKAQSEGIAATDDATLLELAGYTVAVAPGSPLNLKVTQTEDLILAESIAAVLQRR